MNATQGQGLNIPGIIFNSIYVTEGLILGVSNGLLFATIAYHQALRLEKAYVIVAALALADALSGMGTAAAGLYRYRFALRLSSIEPASRRSCFFTPHALLWMFGNPLSGLLILATSIDRLVMVADPLRYLSWDPSYAHKVVGCAYVFSFCQLLYLGLNVWPSTQLDVLSRCVTGESMMPQNFAIHQAIPFWAIMLSIPIYIGVILANRHRINSAISKQSAIVHKQKLERQSRMTRALFLSSLCDIFFFAIPNAIDWVVTTYYPRSLLGALAWVSLGINPAVNLYIFLIKQPEIRVGFKALLKCKVMPPTLNSWNIT